MATTTKTLRKGFSFTALFPKRTHELVLVIEPPLVKEAAKDGAQPQNEADAETRFTWYLLPYQELISHVSLKARYVPASTRRRWYGALVGTVVATLAMSGVFNLTLHFGGWSFLPGTIWGSAIGGPIGFVFGYLVDRGAVWIVARENGRIVPVSATTIDATQVMGSSAEVAAEIASGEEMRRWAKPASSQRLQKLEIMSFVLAILGLAGLFMFGVLLATEDKAITFVDTAGREFSVAGDGRREYTGVIVEPEAIPPGAPPAEPAPAP